LFAIIQRAPELELFNLRQSLLLRGRTSKNSCW
jgi:hypothetical protein